MSSRRHRSQLLAATLLHLHSLMRERTGMITDLWRKRKNLLCPQFWGSGPQEGLGPQALL
jgi:hypothetical protein